VTRFTLFANCKGSAQRLSAMTRRSIAMTRAVRDQVLVSPMVSGTKGYA
jgi:hypothetical protein